MYHTLTLYALLLILALAAFLRGVRPEQEAILLFLTAAILSTILHPSSEDAPLVSISLLVIDVGVLLGLAAIALRHWRKWAMIAAALQVISTLAHFGRVIDPTFDLTAYAIMESFSSVPQLILLAVAIWRHRRTRPTF